MELLEEHKTSRQPVEARRCKPDRKVTAAMKRIKALELRAAGLDYRAIANAVGWKSPASAHEAVQKEMDGRLQEASDTLRLLEADRLDWMWRECISVMEEQPHWKLWAIDRLLKIMERRAKLFGLDAKENPADLEQQAQLYLDIFNNAKRDAFDGGLPQGWE